VLATRGADEGIDLVTRAFCRAGQDAVLITPPTYGMYSVAAAIQGAAVVKVPLPRSRDFALDPEAVLAAVSATVKLVFLCSPNNPTGPLLDGGAVLALTRALTGSAVVVVDEAYLEFAGVPGLASFLAAHPNLVILRTLSKAFGLAGARVGAVLADPEVVAVLRKILAPYPIPTPVITAALLALSPEGVAAARATAQRIVARRVALASDLAALRCVRRVWPSDANFLLVEVTDPARVMAAGRAAGVIWRDRSQDVPGAIRITVGSDADNQATLATLAQVQP
jgi:histidinol-phosphate aminotransferase